MTPEGLDAADLIRSFGIGLGDRMAFIGPGEWEMECSHSAIKEADVSIM